MKVIDILKKKVTVLPNVSGWTYHQELYDYTQTIMTVEDILFVLSKKYKEQIDVLREIEYDSKEQLKKKDECPSWFVGGTFPMMKTCDVDILEYSNLLAIDIDLKENKELDFEDAKRKLIELPYVILVSKSIRGKGIYALILVEDGKLTKEYYKYISKLWKQKYGYITDGQCTNIGRKRFLSYDDNMIIKEKDVDIVPWKLFNIETNINTKTESTLYSYRPLTVIGDNYEFTRKAVWYLLDKGYSIDDINGTNQYSIWYHIGCDFRHFTDGEEMFIRFSNNTLKYKDNIQTILKKWKNTKEEQPFEEISRKWCGICKNKYGKYWYKERSLEF